MSRGENELDPFARKGMERSYLMETPPYCPTAACYVHGMAWEYTEHHVPACPVSKTYRSSFHQMDHALRDLGDAMLGAIQPIVDFGQTLWRSLPWYQRLRLRIEGWLRR